MTASAVLARAAITLNEYFSVTQIDASIIGFMGAMLWWWMPSKRPAAPKPGQPERLERMTDRIDAFVAGLLLAVLINVRIQLTPYAQTFDVAHAPFLHTFQYSMPCTAAIVYLAWLHVIVPLVRGKAKPTAADAGDDKPKPAAAAKAVAGAATAGAGGAGAEAGAKPERSATFDVMDRVVQLWNLFLSAGSFVMLVGLIDALIGYGSQCGWSVVEMIIDSTRARWHGPGFFLVYLFQMSKFIELFDTVLLVAKRKAVSFLHWYHHTTVLLYCWLAVSCTYAPGWWFGTVNCAVHTIMYWYYFRSACGVKLSYDKFITTIQLVQMAIGVAVTGAWTYFYFTHPPAAAGMGPYAQGLTPTVVIASSAIMYASYFVLFFAFYIDRYWRKRAAAAAGKTGKPAGTGVPVKVAKPTA